MNKKLIVTGATSGFGKAIAEKFASHSYDVIICGRRAERLKELADELVKKYKVEVFQLPFDIRDRQAVQDAFEKIPESFKPIDILVNNAGLALGRDYFDEASLEDWEIMIDTNIKGLLYSSKFILPILNSSGGHVFNIGSTAGKEVYEKGNVYCASKHAVDAISKAMRIDLLRKGIRVTAIHPGAAETEFSLVRFKGDQEKADQVYEGYEPLSAEDIATVVFSCAELPQHVCINELIITCTAQANSFYLHRT